MPVPSLKRGGGGAEPAAFRCRTGRQLLLHATGNTHTQEGRADAEWPQRVTTVLSLWTLLFSHCPWGCAMLRGFSLSVLLTFWARLLWGGAVLCALWGV